MKKFAAILLIGILLGITGTLIAERFFIRGSGSIRGDALTLASIALMVVAIFVPLAVAFIGFWSVGPYEVRISERVRKQVDEHYKKVGEDLGKLEKKFSRREAELKGLQYIVSGFIFAKLRVLKPEFMDQAIKDTRRAYSILPDDSDRKFVAMNNLAFYLSHKANTADAFLVVNSFAPKLLARYSDDKEPEWLNTYAATVAAYPGRFAQSRSTMQDALRMLQELIDNPEVSETDRQNAHRHQENIQRALDESNA